MIEPEAAEPNPLVLELKADVFEVLEVEAEAIKELLELDWLIVQNPCLFISKLE